VCSLSFVDCFQQPHRQEAYATYNTSHHAAVEPTRPAGSPPQSKPRNKASGRGMQSKGGREERRHALCARPVSVVAALPLRSSHEKLKTTARGRARWNQIAPLRHPPDTNPHHCRLVLTPPPPLFDAVLVPSVGAV